MEQINTLFENNNGEWIVTNTNKEGKTMMGLCKNETLNINKDKDDCITLDVEHLTFRPIAKHIAEKCSSFFVRDILNLDKRNNCLYFQNVPIQKVLICGVITSVYLHNNKYYFSVDDSTSSIMCIASGNQLETIKIELEKCDEAKTVLKSTKDCNLSWASIVLSQEIQRNLRSFPQFNDQNLLGRFVFVTGTLSEYRNNLYIFVMKVKICHNGSLDFINFVENMKDHYIKKIV